MMLNLTCEFEHTSFARISIPRRQPVNQGNEDVEDSHSCAADVVATFSGMHRLLQQQCTPSVLWHSGNSDALVACMHKSSVPKAFKAMYQGQQKLGIKLAADIKQAVTLKAMSGLELQIAQASAIASVMEASGWQYFANGRWLHSVAAPQACTAHVLGGTPGIAHATHCVKLAMLPASDAPGKADGRTLAVQVVSAGRVQYTPLSLAHELKVGGLTTSTSARAEVDLIYNKILSDPQACRRAARQLYNTPCTLMPSFRPMLIKGIKSCPHDVQGVVSMWKTQAPWLDLESLLQDQQVWIEVSQDYDADSGDAGVLDVPACMVCTASGLTDVIGPQQDQHRQHAVQQLIDSLTSSFFMLWGNKPLKLVSSTDLLPGDIQQHTSSSNNKSHIKQQRTNTTAPPAPDNAALTSHLFRRSEGGNADNQAHVDPAQTVGAQMQRTNAGDDDAAGAKTSLWTTASQHAGTSVQHGRDVMPAGSQACDTRPLAHKQSKWRNMPITVHASSFWWFKGAVDIATSQEGSEGCGGGSGDATFHISGLVAGIMAKRPVLRKQETQQWSHVNILLKKVVGDTDVCGEVAEPAALIDVSNTNQEKPISSVQPKVPSFSRRPVIGGTAGGSKNLNTTVAKTKPPAAPKVLTKPAVATPTTVAAGVDDAAVGKVLSVAAGGAKKPTAVPKAPGTKPAAAKKTKAALSVVAPPATPVPAAPHGNADQIPTKTTAKQDDDVDGLELGLSQQQLLTQACADVGGPALQLSQPVPVMRAAASKKPAGTKRPAAAATTNHSVAGGVASDIDTGACAVGGTTTLATAAAAGTEAEKGPVRKRTKASDLDLSVVEAKVTSQASTGHITGLSVPEMQAWLKARKLAVGGKKAELEARIASALGLPAPAALTPAQALATA